ncbi:MAG: hypothetical protein AVDCRST_MAG67-702 [uncultured Solirubrobacteraceae bacterium]|uniref:Uncharacterized protein n=1 Tax=uncultured Solirubrobacteraceae bacterium TaxID=1162706 RepID=A0A6J4RPA2_9ACTN|nr:MAG: hypothetical protein AVDCRST_MAG67-702 [uncultured Solirubrobacteraceae bacterium]
MEIVIVILLLLIIAGLAFAWMKFRPGAPGSTRGVHNHADGIRGQRRSAVAAREDPMAEAVERHSMATDPHEAAEAELRLQAQANRVASDLHARQASALESEAHGTLGRGHTAPVNGYAQPAYGDGRPLHEDEQGRPVHEDGRQPAYTDENGRPVYEDDRPRY